MIKKIISFILILLMLVSCFGITAYAVSPDTLCSSSVAPLRAGGGGGSGGGGGGGGSGGGSHSHYSGTGRQPTPIELILRGALMFCLAFSSSIAFYILLTKRSRKAKKLMKQMLQSDNAWKYADISDTVRDSFMTIQIAWMNMDMAPAAQYMSDELLESFRTKLNWMAYRKEKNILQNIQLLQALPVAVHDDADNSRDYIWFYIKGRMVDYIINTDTQLLVSGSTLPASFVEYWQFTRKDNNWVLNWILQKDEADQIPFTE